MNRFRGIKPQTSVSHTLRSIVIICSLSLPLPPQACSPLASPPLRPVPNTSSYTAVAFKLARNLFPVLKWIYITPNGEHTTFWQTESPPDVCVNGSLLFILSRSILQPLGLFFWEWETQHLFVSWRAKRPHPDTLLREVGLISRGGPVGSFSTDSPSTPYSEVLKIAVQKLSRR